jgi:hypothetical protein
MSEIPDVVMNGDPEQRYPGEAQSKGFVDRIIDTGI